MSLAAEVENAIKQMSWLKPSDGAAKELALTYARQIDAAAEDGPGPDLTKALYLGPHLLNALRALGGTPAERKALGEEAVSGNLAKLRSLKGGKAS